MRNLIIGIVIGLLLGAGLAWAATRAVPVNGSYIELGTTANPMVVSTI